VLPVPNVLIRIMSQLSDTVERTGFTLVDPVDISDMVPHDPIDQAAIQMLCYRKMRPGAPTMLLELCHLFDQRWITAMLWRPEDLLAQQQAGSVDEVALHHRSWIYDPLTDLEPLAVAITAEITGWLNPEEAPPDTTDDLRG
jgi:hypothetical protein